MEGTVPASNTGPAVRLDAIIARANRAPFVAKPRGGACLVNLRCISTSSSAAFLAIDFGVALLLEMFDEQALCAFDSDAH
jgi:hypothetical protein